MFTSRMFYQLEAGLAPINDLEPKAPDSCSFRFQRLFQATAYLLNYNRQSAIDMDLASAGGVEAKGHQYARGHSSSCPAILQLTC